MLRKNKPLNTVNPAFFCHRSPAGPSTFFASFGHFCWHRPDSAVFSVGNTFLFDFYESVQGTMASPCHCGVTKFSPGDHVSALFEALAERQTFFICWHFFLALKNTPRATGQITPQSIS